MIPFEPLISTYLPLKNIISARYMNCGTFLDKNTRVEGRFLRELMLELNLKSFTGRVLVKGEAPEGAFTLRVHLRDGLPTYCFLSIEGGVLTSDKCVEVISEIFCVNCELYLERTKAAELLEDEALAAVQTKISQLNAGGEIKFLLTNPITQLLLIRYSSSSKTLRGELREILKELKALSLGKAVIAIIKGSNFEALLTCYGARLLHGILTRYIMDELSNSFIREVITEESLSKIEKEYGSEVVDCTAYVVEKLSFRK